jgi:hypothetical protein
MQCNCSYLNNTGSRRQRKSHYNADTIWVNWLNKCSGSVRRSSHLLIYWEIGARYCGHMVNFSTNSATVRSPLIAASATFVLTRLEHLVLPSH